MTLSIDPGQRQRASEPGEPEHPADHHPDTIMRCVQAATILALLGGVALSAVEAATKAYLHLNPFASSCFVIAALGGAVLIRDHELADRQAFYRRGQLDGWMRGWRGQPPDVDDPLVR